MEGVQRVGEPDVHNWREKRLAKENYELRDQENLVTYTYLWSDINGRWVFFCNSIGYGLPYAVQYSSPQKIATSGGHPVAVPQAEPNGLFPPSSGEGTWVRCLDPNGKATRAVYIEPRVIVSPFELPVQEAHVAVPAASTQPVRLKP